MAKQYPINTRFGALMVELTEAEEQTLTTKGGISKDSKAVLANAALILSYLSEGPAAPGEIAKAAGINQLSGSWKKATVALVEAGLVERFGYGPATEYRRVELAEEPTAESEASTVWEFHLHHTFILGAPATGKSNLLHALVHQEAASVADGSVVLLGIDPKGSELRVYEGNLFESVSSGTDRESHLRLLRELDEELTRRHQSAVDLSSRIFAPIHGKQTVILFIEELDWVLDDPEAASIVTKILAMGRSAGIFVIAAAQGLVGGKAHRLIPQFANRILFHQRSMFLNDFMLGEGASEAGADSTALAAPTYANGFQGAGIAYAADGGGVQKVRFPEIADEDIAAVIREHMKN